MYHPRIVHLCILKEVAPSKRLNSKALIYLFYLFVSWFHNTLPLLEDITFEGAHLGRMSVLKFEDWDLTYHKKFLHLATM